MNTILKCSNLNKKIGKKVILDNISFEINEGDICGLLGSNGAGKSTLIKSILSLNKSNGSVYICGFNINTDFRKAISNVGAIVETPDFYLYLTGRKNLELKANIFKIGNKEINEVIDLLELNSYIDEKVCNYSLGMKQRLGIALSLLSNPKLLILDEPTNGLDIEGIKKFKDIILKLSKKNISILISSHMLSILDDICNKICIIKDGKILTTGKLEELKNMNSSYIFKVSDTSDVNLTFNTEILDNITFKVECNREFIPLVIESLIKSDIYVYEVIKEEITLEDLFFKLGGLNETNT